MIPPVQDTEIIQKSIISFVYKAIQREMNGLKNQQTCVLGNFCKGASTNPT